MIDSVQAKPKASGKAKTKTQAQSESDLTAVNTRANTSTKGKGKGKAPVGNDSSEEAPNGTLVSSSPPPIAEATTPSGPDIEQDPEIEEVLVRAVTAVASGGRVEEDNEEGEEEDDVSIADLLASANRQAKVFVQAPGAAGDEKGGDAGTLAFALQVSICSHDAVRRQYFNFMKKKRIKKFSIFYLFYFFIFKFRFKERNQLLST